MAAALGERREGVTDSRTARPMLPTESGWSWMTRRSAALG